MRASDDGSLDRSAVLEVAGGLFAEAGLRLGDGREAVAMLDWSRRARKIAAGEVVAAPGSADHSVHIVLSGWACEARFSSTGRQITALLLAGDVNGLRMVDAPVRTSGLSTLTACKLVSINRRELLDALDNDPQLATKLWRNAALVESILAERLVSLGRRPALQRTAHFFCETAYRLEGRSQSPGEWLTLPLNQTDLADVLGISTIHVNRVLQALRKRQFVELGRRRFRIADAVRLRALADFDESYLL